MELSVQETLKNIFALWKKSYVSLLPLTVLSVLCFNSSFFLDGYLLAILLCIPGLYLYNVILLKLDNFITPKIPSEELYSIAFARFPNTLLLFLGLCLIGITLVLIFYVVFGLFAALLSAMIVLVIYSYLLFAYPLVVIDNLSPVSSVKKSIYLINRHVGFITGIFLITGIIEGTFYALGLLLAGFNVGPLLYNLIFTTFNLALSIVVLDELKKSSTPRGVSHKISNAAQTV